MTVRVTIDPPVPTEGYRWEFNRLGPYIENERTGDVSRLPDYYGPVPPAPRTYPLWLVISPVIISAVLLLVFIIWRTYVK